MNTSLLIIFKVTICVAAIRRRWNPCTFLSEIWTTITVCRLWWLWRMNMIKPTLPSSLRWVFYHCHCVSRRGRRTKTGIHHVKAEFSISLTFNVPQGVEEQLQLICGDSPVCRGRHCESVGAAGLAYRWGAGANIYLSIWYTERWGWPGGEGSQDRGNIKTSASARVGREVNLFVNRLFCSVFQLRMQMLSKMTTVLENSPSNTTQEVEVTARAVAGLTQRPDELSPAAQVQKTNTWHIFFQINMERKFC